MSVSDSMPLEVWRPVVGYESIYEASDLGCVRRIRPYYNSKPGGLMKHRNGHGYRRVALYRDNRGGKSYYVHRLVWAAFNGPVPDGLEINHKDGDKANNRLSNLELVTKSQNAKHAIGLGVWPIMVGRTHGMAKLDENDVEEIRRLYSGGMLQREIAERFHISRPHVSEIVNRKLWQHI